MSRHRLPRLFALPALLLATALAQAAPAVPSMAGAVPGKGDAPPALPAPVSMRACIFDPVGTTGPIGSLAKDLALEARKWNLMLTIKVYTDERVAAEEFKAGQCEAVAMTTLRARQFNKSAGSIDAPGNLRSYDEVKTLLRALANPAFLPMSVTGRYQVAGVVPIGALFVMVNDRSINSIEKAAGKRVAVLDWDTSQAKMISAIGARPVLSDITSYGGKFNNGQADIIAAPAMAYQPLELYRGIGSKGGIFRFPLLHATGSIIIRRDILLPQIPDLDDRLMQLRGFGLRFIDSFINMLRAAEKDIPPSLYIDLSEADKAKYWQMLREARIAMTKDGIYDPAMMNLMKKVRCRHEPADPECSSFDE